jgi:hypothetical protein
MASLVLAIAPAIAHHKDGHDGPGSSNDRSDSTASDHDGDADSDSNTASTEDNDTNDGGTPNNVADEGDNAHPSGKDRSVEHGGSNNQGKSESNPDNSKGPMRYEGGIGDDKPNGPGGTDLADQDGNNGCGNDDDFDDDNNGWCGKPKDDSVSPSVAEKVCPKNTDMAGLPPGVHGCDISDFKVCPVDTDMAGLPMEKCDFDDVLGGDKDDDALGGREDEASGGGRSKGDTVLGSVIAAPASAGAPGSAGAPAVAAETVAAPGGALPFTGAGLLSFIAAGLAMIAAGAFVTRKRT